MDMCFLSFLKLTQRVILCLKLPREDPNKHPIVTMPRSRVYPKEMIQWLPETDGLIFF